MADFDSEAARADRLATDLRADAAVAFREFQIIALASALTLETKAASLHAGIDEIIMKPMSPKYLVERVLARLAKAKPSPQPERRPTLKRGDWSVFGDNVVPLSRYRQPEHAV